MELSMLSPPPALMPNIICTYGTEIPLSGCNGTWLSRIDPYIPVTENSFVLNNKDVPGQLHILRIWYSLHSFKFISVFGEEVLKDVNISSKTSLL